MYKKSRLASICYAMALILISGFGLTADAEKGVIIRSASLKASPKFSAKTVQQLFVGTQVAMLQRKGGWQKVTVLSDKQVEGWLRAYQIRTNIPPEDIVKQSNKKGGTNVLGELSNWSRAGSKLFGQREMKQGKSLTSTLGIRGLTESDLKNARPSLDEFNKLKKNAVSAKQAKSFAKQAGLKAKKIKGG